MKLEHDQENNTFSFIRRENQTKGENNDTKDLPSTILTLDCNVNMFHFNITMHNTLILRKKKIMKTTALWWLKPTVRFHNLL